jgi:hypothetical protein
MIFAELTFRAMTRDHLCCLYQPDAFLALVNCQRRN